MFKFDKSSDLLNEQTNIEEQVSIDNNDLEKQFKVEDKKLIHSIKKWSFRIFGVLAVAYIFVYFTNLFLPEELRWLSSDDLSALKETAIAIAVGVGSAICNSIFFKK